MKQSISFEEILGTSNFLLIDKYTSLATEYSKIEDIANSKKYATQQLRPRPRSLPTAQKNQSPSCVGPECSVMG